MPRRRRSESNSASASRQGRLGRGLSSTPVGLFFIDTGTGQVATLRQLDDAGIVSPRDALPPRPWHRIQGTGDASTMWYAVLRKRDRKSTRLNSSHVRISYAVF